jgi:hypothetical protein
MVVSEAKRSPGSKGSLKYPLAVGNSIGGSIYISTTVIQVRPPGYFAIYFYNHAHHEKLLCLELPRFPRSSNGYFKPLLDPGGGFTSETTARRFQK